MASYKTKIARLNALLDAQALVIQEYALVIEELQFRMRVPVQADQELHTSNAAADRLLEGAPQ